MGFKAIQKKLAGKQWQIFYNWKPNFATIHENKEMQGNIFVAAVPSNKDMDGTYF